MPDLLDASVWLPLSAPDHGHHARARRYWDRESADQLGFCRVTALALLSLLTNRHVLGDVALDGSAAWDALGIWLATPRVTMLPESAGLDEVLGGWAADMDIRAAHWTDAYLAAFAVSSGARLVTFDSDFARFGGLTWVRLAD